MKTAERELMDDAIATLIAALAHDEAQQHAVGAAELADMRSMWIADAERIVDVAARCGLLETEEEEDEIDE